MPERSLLGDSESERVSGSSKVNSNAKFALKNLNSPKAASFKSFPVRSARFLLVALSEQSRR